MHMTEITFNKLAGILFDKADDGGSGGGGSDDPKPPKKPPVDPPVLSDEVMASLKNLIEKSGGSEETAKILYDDNKHLRDKVRGLEDKVLSDGKVAIDASDAEIITKIKELGGIESVSERLKSIEEKENEIAEFERKSSIAKIAENYGYNNAVLADLTKGYEVTTEETKDGDKTELKAFVKTDDGKTELSKFIEAEKAMYLPALQVESGSKGGGKRITAQHSQKKNGEGSATSTFNSFKERRAKRSEQGNPLLPKTQTE